LDDPSSIRATSKKNIESLMNIGTILSYLDRILDFKVMWAGLGGVALMGIVIIG